MEKESKKINTSKTKNINSTKISKEKSNTNKKEVKKTDSINKQKEKVNKKVINKNTKTKEKVKTNKVEKTKTKNKISNKEIKKINEDILSNLKTENRYCENCGNKITSKNKKCPKCKSKVNIKNNKAKFFLLDYINSAGQGRALDVLYNVVAEHTYAFVLSLSFAGSLLGPILYDAIINNRIDSPAQYINIIAKEVKKEELKEEPVEEEKKEEEPKKEEINQEVQQPQKVEEPIITASHIAHNGVGNVMIVTDSGDRYTLDVNGSLDFRITDPNARISVPSGVNYTFQNGVLTLTPYAAGDFDIYVYNGSSSTTILIHVSAPTVPTGPTVLEFD